MQFVLPLRYGSPADAPPPGDAAPAVGLRSVPGGHVAALIFPGVADDGEVSSRKAELLTALAQDGYVADTGAWRVARYNDPGTKPAFRRNEVLVPVTNFDLWGQP